ncbi:MAG: EAL domain-containing protein [Methylococcales bacterium]
MFVIALLQISFYCPIKTGIPKCYQTGAATLIEKLLFNYIGGHDWTPDRSWSSPVEPELEHREWSQQALQKREQGLLLLSKQLMPFIETLPDAIIFKDGEGRFIIANKCARELFKLDSIAWQGKTSLELSILCPSIHSLHSKYLIDDEPVWNARNLLVTEEQVYEEGDAACVFEVRKTPFFKENGERKGLIVIGRDITRQRMAELELRIADTVIEAQEGIVITDAKLHVVRVNTAFTRLTGYSPEEVLGKSPALLKSGCHDQAFYQALWDELILEKYWQGEIWDRRKNGEIYSKWLSITAVTDLNGGVSHYVGVFTDLSEKKALHRLAYFDPLTDLPNRRLLNDRLELAMIKSDNNHQYAALLMIDLDNFKAINDTKGHSIGDQLLVEVALRLKSCIRQSDILARLGGDEFVILLEDLGDEQENAVLVVQSVGEKILKAINQPYLLGGQKHHNSASIGINMFSGIALASEELIKHADIAMYAAKHAGRNSLFFFDPDTQAILENRVTLETELHHALTEEQLELYYQVQVDNTCRMLGAEVLLRWKHPHLGFVSPAEFIPIAEETGLILPIGDWVLRTACLQLKVWENSPLTRDLELAVNVSARQFSQQSFVEQLCKMLVETGANPTRLKLELTESLVMNNVTETIEKMQRLKLLGIRFSMDDFGTGYSSLSSLKKLPLAQLKIDQSFVRDIITDPNDAIIVQTIIGMAHNLGLNVIAEGVETEEQRLCLEGLGCCTYQGYLFSRPVKLAEFEVLLNRPASSDELSCVQKLNDEPYIVYI